MDIVKYKGMKDFMQNFNDTYNYFYKTKKYEYRSMCIIAMYDEMVQIVNELVRDGYNLCCVKLYDPEFDGYEAEWFCSVDEEKNIWCQKAYYCAEDCCFNGHYIHSEEYDFLFVHKNVSRDFLMVQKGDYLIFDFVEEEDTKATIEKDVKVKEAASTKKEAAKKDTKKSKLAIGLEDMTEDEIAVLKEMLELLHKAESRSMSNLISFMDWCLL